MYAQLIAETTAQPNERFPMELPAIDITRVLITVAAISIVILFMQLVSEDS